MRTIRKTLQNVFIFEADSDEEAAEKAAEIARQIETILKQGGGAHNITVTTTTQRDKATDE
jgi:hypothetical protein